MRNVSAAILPGLFLAAAPVWASAEEGARTWHFTVLLDGRHIGEHDFAVTHRGDDVVVDTAAHFKVVVAFIPVYAYNHQDREVWRNGCLLSLSSHTNDNGKQEFVEGALAGQAFAVRSAGTALTLPACVRSFAYWDASLLAEPPLLNSQTGEFQSATLAPDGTQDIRVGARTLAARRYALRGPHLSIDVWYSDSGQWVALESKLENGRTLRYEIQ